MERKRVVVIGHQWETQMMTACALEGAGYDAITLFDRRRALQAVREIQPDLILVDLALPKLKAIELIRSLRKDGRTQQVPIIGIVPGGEQREAGALHSGGLADVYSRPFDHKSLIRKVRRVLQDDRGAGNQTGA